MAKLTKALVQRHAGRPDAYGAALLDIAQDHLLSVIASAGFFDTGDKPLHRQAIALEAVSSGVKSTGGTELVNGVLRRHAIHRIEGIVEGAIHGGFIEESADLQRAEGRKVRTHRCDGGRGYVGGARTAPGHR